MQQTSRVSCQGNNNNNIKSPQVDGLYDMDIYSLTVAAKNVPFLLFLGKRLVLTPYHTATVNNQHPPVHHPLDAPL
jgi:hypothetical protein